MTPDAATVTPLGAPLSPEEARRVAAALEANIARALRGKQDIIELALAALAAGGHLLLEDVPGVGKTTLAQALSRSLALSFSRRQFTSDLPPAHTTGVSVFYHRAGASPLNPAPPLPNLLPAAPTTTTPPT